jgi:hypothetical protein
MWVRTEQGAVNLEHCRSILVEKESDEGHAYVVCAHMTDATHVPIAVRAEYSDARAACDRIVGHLVGDAAPKPAGVAD